MVDLSRFRSTVPESIEGPTRTVPDLSLGQEDRFRETTFPHGLLYFFASARFSIVSSDLSELREAPARDAEDCIKTPCRGRAVTGCYRATVGGESSPGVLEEAVWVAACNRGTV